MTGRQAANALSRLTWIFAIGFIITSITLTVIAARNASSGSIVDQLDLGAAQEVPASDLPAALENYAPPPGAGQPIVPGAAQPVTPPAAPAPASPAPAEATGSAPAAPASGTPATPAPAATN